ncbi:hypothetical protein J3P71_20910 [Rhizobium leguminosarum]|uniref:hypothetical protein n=1 Tax=Rhizobium leguminosarum TaxID=384 RepID=UPI001442900C|nr:hypothetical protein [Rhizobium leguminosarum]MBY5841308.1 hypothetical protein [Rhizobium leguminosarum]NKM80933.1 hypothetical protein [Rhizobium leguminosarum bv. viciae]QSZ07291.1 hypothetical protein J3P71_20910 [Rhizobium leguminosarum]
MTIPHTEQPSESTRDADGILRVIMEASKNHPKASVLLIVLAIVLIAGLAQATFAFSIQHAALFTGLILAVMHLCRELWESGRRKRGSFTIGRFMTAAFSLMLLAASAALLVSEIGCRYGYLCAADSGELNKVRISHFGLLDETKVDVTHADFRLTEAIPVSRTTVKITDDAQPVVALAMAIDRFAHRSDGSIDVRVVLQAGVNSDELADVDVVNLRGVEDWKAMGIVNRYHGRSAGLVSDLTDNGLNMDPDASVLVSALSCLDEFTTKGGFVVKAIVFDRVAGKFAETPTIPVQFMGPASAERSSSCSTST